MGLLNCFVLSTVGARDGARRLWSVVMLADGA
jgi:hypothetical protein